MFEFNATFIVAIISFVVFIIIMNAIFYKPVLKIIEERKNFIDGNYNDAKNSNDKAQSLLDNKEKRLSETRETSRKIIKDKTAEANEKSSSILNDAKQSCQNRIQSAKDELKNQELALDLSGNIEDISDSISKKLLGEV